MNTDQSDKIIAAELRRWGVAGLWRQFDLNDMESYIRLCRKFGVSTDLPAVLARKCRHCDGEAHGRPDKVYCSDRCKQAARKARSRSLGAGQAPPKRKKARQP